MPKFAHFVPAPLLRQSFALFDTNDTGTVTLEELEAGVLEIFKEREFMARTLKDTHKIIKEVGRLIFGALLLLSVYLSTIVWGDVLVNYWQVGGRVGWCGLVH